MRTIIFIILHAFVDVSSTFKILVYSPTFGRSHMISNARIADTLTEAGHNVTLFEPVFVDQKFNASKKTRVVRVEGLDPAPFLRAVGSLSSSFFEPDSISNNYKFMIAFQDGLSEMCEELLAREDVIEKLRAEKFDAFFGEQLNPCGSALSQVLGIKVHFWISSCPISYYTAWILGIPLPPSFVPTSSGVDIGDKLTYFERANNLLHQLVDWYIFDYASKKINQIFRRRFGSSYHDVEETLRDSAIVFVASDVLLDFPHPILPNVVHIGGLGAEDSKQSLDAVFAAEMKKGEDGVVYFAMGSNVNTARLPAVFLENVFEAFDAFPQIHFIMKANKEDQTSRDLAKGRKNVFITDWAPQPALLAHPRLRAFITHGGYNSLMEASRVGVPLVPIGFFADQLRNARAAERGGWAIPISKHHLLRHSQPLTEALMKLLNDKKYSKAAERVSRLVRKQPFTAAEKLVKWTEFAIENGGLPELLSEGRLLSSVVYHNLDIVLPLVLLLSLLWLLCCGFS